MPNEVKDIFNQISPFYDKVNNLISFCTHKYFKSKAISTLKLADNMKVLDLCCGSGDLISLILKRNQNVNIIGLDFSSKMLEVAKKKGLKASFIEADVQNIPFAQNEFDIVTIGFGLRNIPNKTKALEEISRVVKPNGYFLHLDFEGRSEFSFLYDRVVIFLLKFFLKDIKPYLYLIESKKNYVTSIELIDFVRGFDFECVNCKKMFFNTVSYHLFQKKS